MKKIDVTQLLCCPLTGESLHWASPDTIELLNEEIRLGRLFHQIGTQVEDPLQAGLVNESQSCFIMVRDDIPELIPDQTIPIDHLELPGPH